MVSAVEINEHGAECGFGFEPGESLLRDNDEALELRSHLAAYAAEIMLRQHRTHLYMFYISGWRARAFRWDRNGAVVSHPIDLRTNRKQLLNLIYRLVMADPRTQGFDTTASLASVTETEKLWVYEPNNTYLEEYKNIMLNNALEHPIYKVCISLVSQFQLSPISALFRSNATKCFNLMTIGGCVHRDGKDSSSVNMLRADTPQ